MGRSWSGNEKLEKFPFIAHIPVVIATVARPDISGGLWEPPQADGGKGRCRQEGGGKGVLAKAAASRFTLRTEVLCPVWLLGFCPSLGCSSREAFASQLLGDQECRWRVKGCWD